MYGAFDALVCNEFPLKWNQRFQDLQFQSHFVTFGQFWGVPDEWRIPLGEVSWRGEEEAHLLDVGLLLCLPEQLLRIHGLSGTLAIILGKGSQGVQVIPASAAFSVPHQGHKRRTILCTGWNLTHIQSNQKYQRLELHEGVRSQHFMPCKFQI